MLTRHVRCDQGIDSADEAAQSSISEKAGTVRSMNMQFPQIQPTLLWVRADVGLLSSFLVLIRALTPITLTPQLGHFGRCVFAMSIR